ncbi:MAG: holin [Clostridium sp. SCN 57-10]|mgnify:CR=1 FL=1|nr:MAG: holin [Clostridium sp. SCN 57-10]
MKIEDIKNAVLAIVAGIGTVIAKFCGGWDTAMQTLVFVMAVDYITGLIVAGVFKRSNKSSGGALDSRAGFKGLCKKGVVLLIVMLSTYLDRMVGTDTVVRTATILFFIGNEGLSVIENIGLMGVPFPPSIKNALEALQKKSEK